MSKKQSGELIREYPVSIWIIAIICFAGGLFFFFNSSTLPALLGGTAIGLLFIALSNILIISAEDGGRTLVLEHIGLLKRSRDELEVGQIHSIFVQRSRSGDDSTTYRVVIRMQDGQVFPLRSYYTSGFQSKERTANKLREALGVSGQDQNPRSMMEMASQLVQEVYQGSGQILEEMEEQEARGVRWQMQTITFGATPITRWLSKDFTTPNQFLYLVQKLEDQDSGKMVMSLMGKPLMKQSLQMYGFTENDLPDFDNAVVLTNLDKRMNKFFLGYTSDEAWAQHILNAWVVMPLVGWASDHPLRQGVRQPDNFSQLAVLFSPNGVYVSCLGVLTELETEQLVDLGVEIVRANGG